jgi:hypothetical protein
MIFKMTSLCEPPCWGPTKSSYFGSQDSYFSCSLGPPERRQGYPLSHELRTISCWDKPFIPTQPSSPRRRTRAMSGSSSVTATRKWPWGQTWWSLGYLGPTFGWPQAGGFSSYRGVIIKTFATAWETYNIHEWYIRYTKCGTSITLFRSIAYITYITYVTHIVYNKKLHLLIPFNIKYPSWNICLKVLDLFMLGTDKLSIVDFFFWLSICAYIQYIHFRML